MQALKLLLYRSRNAPKFFSILMLVNSRSARFDLVSKTEISLGSLPHIVTGRRLLPSVTIATSKQTSGRTGPFKYP